MKMKTLIVICLLATLAVGRAAATNLRGQVVRNVNGYYYPLAGVRVELMVYDGRAWQLGSYAFTGPDGFYFFINFNPGITFAIRINGYYFPPQPLVIQNILPPFYQDIPVISA